MSNCQNSRGSEMPRTPGDVRKAAEEIVARINNIANREDIRYTQKLPVTDILMLVQAERLWTIGECAKVAEQYWKEGRNVYARHAGRAVESRIRALAAGDAGVSSPAGTLPTPS